MLVNGNASLHSTNSRGPLCSVFPLAFPSGISNTVRSVEAKRTLQAYHLRPGSSNNGRGRAREIARDTTHQTENVGGRVNGRKRKLKWQRLRAFPQPLGYNAHGVPTVAGGRKRLRCPFLAKNPLLRCKCTMGCDPSAHIFSCAVCFLKVVFTTFLFSPKKSGLHPKVTFA